MQTSAKPISSILLSLKPDDNLSWEKEIEQAKNLKESGHLIFWKLNLGLTLNALSDVAFFRALSLGLEHFSKTIWPEFEKDSQGILLYEGSVAFSENLLPSFLEWVEDTYECKTIPEKELPYYQIIFATNVLAEYLHRLASHLPDTAPLYCELQAPSFCAPAQSAHLFSQERFPHINLMDKDLKKDNESKVGVCLPPDEKMVPGALKLFDEILSELKKRNIRFRVIPEALLTELWEGIETLFVLENYLTVLGIRKLRGFEASGGLVERRK